MKHVYKLTAATVLLTCAASLLFAALPFTDAFTATDGTSLPTYSANWTVVAQAAVIYGNAVGCNSGASSCMAKDNSNTYSGNQIATGIVKTPSSGVYAGLALNVTTGDNGYQCRVDNNEVVLLRRGTSSTLWSATTPTVQDGDELRAWRDGNNLYCQLWRSGVMQYNSGAVAETTHTAGSPGIAGFGVVSGSTYTRIDDVTFDNYSAGGGAPARKRAPVPMMFGFVMEGK